MQTPPHETDQIKLVNSLDNTWRTPTQIKLRFKPKGWVFDLAMALERLADTGQIDRKSQGTVAPKRGGGNLTIQLYRRCQAQ